MISKGGVNLRYALLSNRGYLSARDLPPRIDYWEKAVNGWWILGGKGYKKRLLFGVERGEARRRRHDSSS